MALSDSQRVLVVEDDYGSRTMIKMVLEDAGYRVQDAPEGASALAALRYSRMPAVVVFDLRMPGMDGEQFLRAIAADDALAHEHGYILITADSTAPSQGLVTLVERLRVPILQKPFNIDQLLDLVAATSHRLPVGVRAAWDTGLGGSHESAW